MKKHFYFLLSALCCLIIFSPLTAFACTMKLTSTTSSVSVGENITLRLERTATHRTCVVPLEQTTIKVSSGEVVDPGIWKKGNPDILEFSVRFTQAGPGTVVVERNCPKEGLLTAQTTVTVYEKASIPEKSIIAKPDQGVPTDTAAKTVSPESRSISWQMGLTSWWADYAEPFIIWLFIFALGLILHLRKAYSLRVPLLVISLILTGFYLGGCPCPVGAWYYLLSENKDIFGLVLLLLLIPILFTLFRGRIFCGWMCPIGAIQELLKAESINWEFAPATDKLLRKSKYLLLIVFSLATLWKGINYWSHFEPFKSLFNFSGTTIRIILLVIVLAWSIVLGRPFCRYFCPLGAILALTSRFSLTKIVPDSSKCVHCGICVKSHCCPTSAIEMNVQDKNSLPVIDAAECIRCGKCINVCPRKVLNEISADTKK